MKFSKDQQVAIDIKGTNVLVSAGAGSGKTAVLTERVVSLLNDDLKINNILVLTFTKNAAKEMKDRIRLKLEDRNDSLNLLLLDNSYITTFDAFSLSILERYHDILNLSPGIGILSEEALSYITRENINKIFYKAEYKKIRDMFLTDNEDKLIDSLIKIKSSLNILPNPKEYLLNYKINYNLIEEYKSYINDKFIEIKEAVDTVGGTEKFINELFISLDKFLKSKNFTEIASSIKDVELPRFSNLKDISEEEKKLYADRYSEFKKSIDDLKIKLLKYKTEDDLKEELDKNYEIELVIKDMMLELLTMEEIFMKKNNKFSFNKIASMGIELLEKNKIVREELKKEFKEIMIDEYQDTSDIQDNFISLISNNNVYMVGDIKQSIYRFRNANPKIFRDKYENYKNLSGGRKIDLNCNYRSRKEVLDGINDIFNYIMTLDKGGASYKEEHQLVFGNMNYEKEQKENNIMKIYTYDTDGNVKDLEINFIANDIKNKIENKYQVIDKKTNKLRDITYSDIAIIVRSGTNDDLYKKVLNKYNIPVKLTSDKKINDNSLVLVLRSVLNAIYLIANNKKNSLNYFLTSIARSFLFRLDDDVIYDIIVNKKEFSFYEKLKELSYLANDYNVNDLLEKIIDEFNIFEKLNTTKNIEEKIIVLDKIIDITKEFSALNLTITDLIKCLDLIVDKKIEIKVNIDEDINNSLTITNIHKSKGLEYNICYFPSLTSGANNNKSKEFSFSEKYGIICPYIKDKIYLNSLKIVLLDEEEQKEEESEKIRLFYVALTRAKEEMILLTSNKETKNTFATYLDNIKEKYSLSVKDVEIKEASNNDLTINEIDDKLIIINREEIKELMKESHYSKLTNKINDKETIKLMKLGTHVHEILEYLDFNNPDFSNIEEEYLDKIKAFLNQDIDFKNAIKIYKEYEFYYEKEDETKHGIIDLMIEYDDHIKIIDYKLSNIDDKNYIKQLNGYKEYIEKYKDKKVKLYLYSILKEELKEID